MIYKGINYYLLLVLLTFASTCQKLEWDNPLDPNSDLKKYYLQIEEGPENDSTVGEENVTFSWSSNGSVFEYKISNAEHLYPTEWTEIYERSITFSDLDDIDEYYKFDLRIKEPEISEITSRRFKINAIQNSSIWLKNRKQIVTLSSSTFYIEVMLKEVTNLALVNVEIDFEKEKFELINIQKETEFWTKSDPNAEIIFLPSDISDANENGKLDFSIGLVNTENYVASGSGILATLQFTGRNLDGQIHYMQFTNQTKFRNADNEDIIINEKVKAKIKLES